MSYTVTLRQRIAQLKKALDTDLPEVLSETAKGATLRAIEAAQDATPPKAGTGRLGGTNTLTGELKAHWATDSRAEPERTGDGYKTELANNMEYASYVDQGHRMDRHFVPGLYVDENGQLNYDPAADVGIVVGTKTKWVKGEFMADKGREAYEKTVLAELEKRVQEVLE